MRARRYRPELLCAGSKDAETLSAIKFIAVTAGAVVDVSFYKLAAARTKTPNARAPDLLGGGGPFKPEGDVTKATIFHRGKPVGTFEARARSMPDTDKVAQLKADCAKAQSGEARVRVP